MYRNILLAAVLATAVAVPVRADGVLDVTANSTSSVYLDGELIGETPIRVRAITHGSHELKLMDSQTGKIKVYRFNVGANHAKTSHIRGKFLAADPAWAVVASGDRWPTASTPATVSSFRSSSDIAVSNGRGKARGHRIGKGHFKHRKGHGHRGLGHSKHGHDSDNSHDSSTGNQKVRMRNVALGLGALGILTDSDELKGAGLGGAVLNELINE